MNERLSQKLQESVEERELVDCARRLVQTPSVTGSERAVMGSVAREVTHKAPCEVLTVRALLGRRG